jgi:chromate transporter
VAGGLFVLPGALIMLALTMLYALAADLHGLALKTTLQQTIAVGAFAALFLFNAPFPLVVLGALALGAFIGSRWPARLG